MTLEDIKPGCDLSAAAREILDVMFKTGFEKRELTDSSKEAFFREADRLNEEYGHSTRNAFTSPALVDLWNQQQRVLENERRVRLPLLEKLQERMIELEELLALTPGADQIRQFSIGPYLTNNVLAACPIEHQSTSELDRLTVMVERWNEVLRDRISRAKNAE